MSHYTNAIYLPLEHYLLGKEKHHRTVNFHFLKPIGSYDKFWATLEIAKIFINKIKKTSVIIIFTESKNGGTLWNFKWNATKKKAKWDNFKVVWNKLYISPGLESHGKLKLSNNW